MVCVAMHGVHTVSSSPSPLPVSACLPATHTGMLMEAHQLQETPCFMHSQMLYAHTQIRCSISTAGSPRSELGAWQPLLSALRQLADGSKDEDVRSKASELLSGLAPSSPDTATPP